MELYKTAIFKGHHVIKSNLKDGSPYKQRTFLMVVKDTNDFVLCQQRLIQSKNKPDNWCSFVRSFKGNNYWNHNTATKLENYFAVDKFLQEKIFELSEGLDEISKNNFQ